MNLYLLQSGRFTETRSERHLTLSGAKATAEEWAGPLHPPHTREWRERGDAWHLCEQRNDGTPPWAISIIQPETIQD